VSPAARRELIGIGALSAGLFIGLTLLPLPVTGRIGQGLGHLLLKAFGIGAVLLPVLGIGWALAAFERLGSLSTGRAAALVAGLVLLLPYGIGVLTSQDPLPANYGGWTTGQRLIGIFPAFLAETIRGAVGTAGGVLVGLVALSALGLLTVGWHPLVVLRQRGATSDAPAAPTKPAKARRELPALIPVTPAGDADVPGAADDAPPPRAKRKPRGPAPAPMPPPAPGALIPPIDLLSEPSREEIEVDESEIREMGQKLIDTLATFRVDGCQVADRTVGPVVTRYEVAPGPGVKVGRIAALADDLALAIRAQSLRIVAPIPGKAAVGIEVPNRARQMVTLRELLETGDFQERHRVLPVALGRNLEGRSVVDDLAKMPHLLIAGATGSGKSVCINTIITSLCYRYGPDELRLLMIDPKMVELSMYNALPHLRHPVVTNNHKAATVLKWAVREMERRYQLFHANHARNIIDFNRKVRDGKPLKGPRETLATQAGVQTEIPFDAEYADGVLPYVVLIVDELADLMMTVQHEVETPLATLAQKARAIGIHLILATQRPSVNVITGLIKANFPCRIAFRVASKVDSRTILDQNGAEALLGNGDMLFLPPGKSEPVRIQGAFIATDDTERLMDWYSARRAQLEQRMEVDILEQMAKAEAAEDSEEGGAGLLPEDRDPLFRQAAEVCIQNQLGSTSLLQRRMSIGYGRAARIIDQLEEAGILGPANGSKPRDVLIGLEDLDEIVGA
jgi:S-DNA-T family DNA segregation ATPase FtsK/SpoIIIE